LVALVQVKQYLLEWMWAYHPWGTYCKKQQNRLFSKENPNTSKKLKKVFTSKDYFSKLQIRQRCRENKRKSK